MEAQRDHGAYKVQSSSTSIILFEKKGVIVYCNQTKIQIIASVISAETEHHVLMTRTLKRIIFRVPVMLHLLENAENPL